MIGSLLPRRVATATLAFIAMLTAVTGCSRTRSHSSSRGDSLFVGVAVGLTAPERYVNVFEGVQMALD